MAEQTQAVRLSSALHSRVRVYAALTSQTMQSVVEAALKLFLPPVKAGRK